MPSTVRLSNELRSRIIKIGDKLSAKDGKYRSVEDLIELLIDSYEKKEEKDAGQF